MSNEEVFSKKGALIKIQFDLEYAKLEKEYKGGDVIEMYMPGESGIKGRYFRIEEKEGMSYEDFIIIEEKEGFCYQMKEALKGRYPKGSRIYELYHKRADEQGRAEVIVKVRD